MMIIRNPFKARVHRDGKSWDCIVETVIELSGVIANDHIHLLGVLMSADDYKAAKGFPITEDKTKVLVPVYSCNIKPINAPHELEISGFICDPFTGNEEHTTMSIMLNDIEWHNPNRRR